MPQQGGVHSGVFANNCGAVLGALQEKVLGSSPRSVVALEEVVQEQESLEVV